MTTYTDNKATAPELNMYTATMTLDRVLHTPTHTTTELTRALRAAKQSVYTFTKLHPAHVDQEVLDVINAAETLVADYQMQEYLERQAVMNMATKRGQ